MCRLLLGIKLNGKNSPDFAKIIRLQETKLRSQPDGIATLRIDDNNKVKISREMEEYGKALSDIYKNVGNSRIVGVHSRQATSGETNIKNTHFFEVGRYIFAHNGMVSDYDSMTFGEKDTSFITPTNQNLRWDGYYETKGKLDDEIKKEKMCDSYQFIKNIKKPITKKILRREMEKKGFYGVAVLIDKKAKKIFTIATREAKAHTDFKTFFFMYSFDPVNELKNYKKFIGFRIFKESQQKKVELFTIMPGVYELDYNLADSKNLFK